MLPPRVHPLPHLRDTGARQPRESVTATATGVPARGESPHKEGHNQTRALELSGQFILLQGQTDSARADSKHVYSPTITQAGAERIFHPLACDTADLHLTEVSPWKPLHRDALVLYLDFFKASSHSVTFGTELRGIQPPQHLRERLPARPDPPELRQPQETASERAAGQGEAAGREESPRCSRADRGSHDSWRGPLPAGSHGDRAIDLCQCTRGPQSS